MATLGSWPTPSAYARPPNCAEVAREYLLSAGVCGDAEVGLCFAYVPMETFSYVPMETCVLVTVNVGFEIMFLI